MSTITLAYILGPLTSSSERSIFFVRRFQLPVPRILNSGGLEELHRLSGDHGARRMKDDGAPSETEINLF